MIIYKVTNIINGKVYIGQTINTLEYRRSQHFRETKSDKKKNTYFHNAIAKYGEENFIFEQIDSAESIDELNLKEQYCSMEYMVQSGASREYARKASNASAIKSREIHNRKRKEIAEFIYSLCNDNKEIILSCPLNKVSTHLYQLMNIINEKYDLKDIRNLYPCFNVKNSKDLANCLKDYVLNENIC